MRWVIKAQFFPSKFDTANQFEILFFIHYIEQTKVCDYYALFCIDIMPMEKDLKFYNILDVNC